MMTLQGKKRLLPALTLLLLLVLCAGARGEGKLWSLPMDAEAGRMPDETRYLPDHGGYEDPSIRVKIETMRAYDTTITVARVRIAHASQIRTAMAARYGSTGTVRPDKLAQRANAVLAVNGDYFSFNAAGYLVRQGVTYRENAKRIYDMLIIDKNGDFHILVDPTKVKVREYLENGGTIVNSFNFGPALVVDGEIIVTTKRQDSGVKRRTQRMAVGQTGPLEYICVATEGPENPGSKGLTIPQLCELMQQLGVRQAYNLDGGSSTSMLLGGEKINAPDSNKVRAVCDILYFATLVE